MHSIFLTHSPVIHLGTHNLSLALSPHFPHPQFCCPSSLTSIYIFFFLLFCSGEKKKKGFYAKDIEIIFYTFPSRSKPLAQLLGELGEAMLLCKQALRGPPNKSPRVHTSRGTPDPMTV